MRGEYGQALRVGCFDDHDSVACQAAGAELDHLRQPLRRKMLHYLGTEDAVQGLLRKACQVREQVRRLRLESFQTADCDRLLAEIDAHRGNVRLAHGLQKLATAAADVDRKST